jgi:flagellar hook-associated protein 2
VASAASETSKTGYADSGATQVSSTGTVRLVIGSNHYDIGLTPATNNLVGLRDAINKLGVGVTASVLTTGTGLNPNYLSISANSSGSTTLQILDDPTGANTNLITSTNQGSNAVFTLNGVPVTKSDNVINNVIAGVTFTIEKETTLTAPTVTLSLTTDATQLQSAIQDFVTKYNSLVDQVGAQVGPSAGLLSGDFIVREVQSDLRKVTSYQGTGGIQSLSDLGIQAGVDGKLTFDTNVFSALSNSQITSAFDFLGSPTTGFGALADKFSQITDPTSGLIKLEQDGFEAADKRIQSSIGDLNDRISQLQTSMTTRLQAADALQAQLASQQQQLSAILQSLNFTSFGAPGASTNGSTGVG